MRIYEILMKKRNGEKLSDAEIEFLIRGISDGSLPDYQAAAFLMAVFIQGLDAEETTALTRAMMDSGDVLDLSDITADTVDKHSTGGVGDKLSLILAPAAAACGAVVPMMSGRGLGHTGGTLDKLDSIPGYTTDLTEKQLRQALKTVGVAIIGQTGCLAPADKKLYALRDVTATVDSIPLITGSIMSKKFAAGPAAIVMDVKWGSGAFMQTIEEAQALAESLVAVGKVMRRRVSAFITDMNQPLGRMVGNAMEVIETVDCLKGEGPADVMEVSRALTAEMLCLAGKAEDFEQGGRLFDTVIQNGAAFKKFKEMVANQGGDTAALDDTSKLPAAESSVDIAADQDGYITAMDTIGIGTASILLGGGREKSDDRLDYGVGIEVLKKTGDRVAAGDMIARLYYSSVSRKKEAVKKYRESVTIGSSSVDPPEMIVDRIS